ncbi:MAG TPA: hypothetical protein VKX17_00500 [Planctomycetota bacterium]|nr:hypothetical protein [Planctomycetota bacterium]
MGKNVLGLAFGPGLIQVAELSYDVSSARLLKAADFKLEPDALKTPVELGKKFSEFLRQNKFGARSAIAGLPTQWLMLKEKTVPPLSAENLAGMLRLQAERDFSLEPESLSMDYATGERREGGDGGPGSLAVLVAATLRERVGQIGVMLKSAGVSLRAVTASALALSSAMGSETLLSAGPYGVEMVVRARGNLRVPCVLVSTPAEGELWIVPAAPEARRTLAMRAAEPGAEILLWNGASHAAGGGEELSKAINTPVREIRQMGVESSSVPAAVHFGHATALGLLARSAAPIELNFLDSKLVEKEAGAFAKVKAWMAAAALLAVGAIAYLSVTGYQDYTALAAMKKTAAERKTDLDKLEKANKEFADLPEYFVEKRVNVLECMKELKRILPADTALGTIRDASGGNENNNAVEEGAANPENGNVAAKEEAGAAKDAAGTPVVAKDAGGVLPKDPAAGARDVSAGGGNRDIGGSGNRDTNGGGSGRFNRGQGDYNSGGNNNGGRDQNSGGGSRGYGRDRGNGNSYSGGGGGYSGYGGGGGGGFGRGARDYSGPTFNVWVTSISVDDSFRCTMTAKASRSDKYFEVFDRIEKNKRFRDVKLVYMTKGDTKKPEVSFAVSFVYWKQ